MKIISKHKDYYDWAVSIYGMDPIMVYDRRTDNLQKPFPTAGSSDGNKLGPEIHEFSVCNKLYTVYQWLDKFYHTPEELVELDALLKKHKVNENFLGGRYWRYDHKSKIELAKDKYKSENHGSKVNMEIREPVLIKCRTGNYEFTAQVEGRTFFDSSKKVQSRWDIPDLSTYGFARWVDAQKMFQDVYAFISWLKDHPEIPNKQTDTEKIQSHGFSDKTSFRPNMKS